MNNDATQRPLIRLALVGLVVMAATINPRSARAIGTSEIVSSAMSTSCMDFQVIGVCVWMTCTPFGCDFETSVQVRHYLPDLVVSTYHRTGKNPWQDVASMSPPTADARAGGNSTELSSGRDHSNLRFKNADAIGHPAAIVYNAMANSGWTCESSATPFFPYYLSVEDDAWRTPGAVEKKAAKAGMVPFVGMPLPGGGTVGTMGNVWGQVFPRIGFVIQTNDYKAAALTAQRVVDFVTRDDLLTLSTHTYWPLTEDWEPGYWPPGPVIEGDPDRGKWQRLQPNMTQQCAVFPDHSAFESFAGDMAGDGDYVWALWRAYSCCEREGAVLIYFTPPDNGSMN